jgi:uncharacterized protein
MWLQGARIGSLWAAALPGGSRNSTRDCRRRAGCEAAADAVRCRVISPPDHAHQLMDTRLLDILACPLCKGPLQYAKQEQALVCRADQLAFPIRDGIPVMLEDEARRLSPQDPLLND